MGRRSAMIAVTTGADTAAASVMTVDRVVTTGGMTAATGSGMTAEVVRARVRVAGRAATTAALVAMTGHARDQAGPPPLAAGRS